MGEVFSEERHCAGNANPFKIRMRLQLALRMVATVNARPRHLSRGLSIEVPRGQWPALKRRVVRFG